MENMEHSMQPTVEASDNDTLTKPAEENLSQLEKLEARMQKLRRQIALEKRKETIKLRKARTHRLVRTGGLVEMILGEEVDAGLLTGILIQSRTLFENPDSDKSRELKLNGDKEIAKREAAAKAHRANKSNTGSEEDRNAV